MTLPQCLAREFSIPLPSDIILIEVAVISSAILEPLLR